MKRLIGFLVRLYPREWRDRYGDEMNALVEDASPKASTAFDVLKGAVVMRTQKWPFVKLASVLSLAGALIAVGILLIQPGIYQSTAVLQVNGPASESERETAVLQAAANVTSRSSLAGIMSDSRLLLYDSDGQHWPNESAVDKMRSNIRIAIEGNNHSIFRVQFSYTDPAKARATVETLTSRFIMAARETSLQIAILDPAGPGVEENASRRRDFAIAGMATGFLVAVLIAWVRAAFRPVPMRRSAIWPFPKLALVLSVGGVLLAGATAFLIPLTFEARAVMQIRSRSGSGDTNALVKDIEQMALSRDSLTKIMLDPRLNLYESERKGQALEQVVDVMRAHTRIALAPSRPGLTVFSIDFAYSEGPEARQKAHDTVQMIVTRFIDGSIMQRREQLAAGQGVGPQHADEYLELLDPPTVPQKPRSPNRPMIAFTGFVSGLVLAAVLSIGQRLIGPGGTASQETPA